MDSGSVGIESGAVIAAGRFDGRHEVCAGSARAKTAVRVLAAAMCSMLMSACGKEIAAPEPPPPALVIEVGARAQGSTSVYPGEIRAREESTLAFLVDGKVSSRRVDVGDRVRAGDVLAEMDPRDLRLQSEAANARMAASEAQLLRVRADQNRIAALAEDRLVSRSALDQQTAALRAAEAEATAARAQRDLARNQAAYARLIAPRDGVVASRSIEIGQVLAAGEPAFALAVAGEREVAFALPETRIDAFRLGQPVWVELWNDSGRKLPATLSEIAPSADAATRTYAARARLDGDAGAALALGLSARVYIQDTTTTAAMELPLSAIQPAASGSGAPGSEASGSAASGSAASRSAASRSAATSTAVPESAAKPSANARTSNPRGAAASADRDASRASGGQGAATVWVVDPRTRKVRKVAVDIGPYGSERVAVFAGLRPGAWVVAAGGHLLRDGQEVVPVDRDNRPLAGG